MCGTCGCTDPIEGVTLTDPATGRTSALRQDHHHHHRHGDDHGHDHGRQGHDHGHHDHAGADRPHVHGPGGEIISLETAVLAKNDQIAAANRAWLATRGVLALNLVSSPGAGKTTLLEKTVRALVGELDVAVIEGDQMTANDAERIRLAGARAVQINTGAGCHLEADMIAAAIESLDPQPGSLLLIENVGNLVCPAMFDLGERMKVAVISTTEGEDKPLKYPHMFRAAALVLVNKIDLAPHLDFDEAVLRANVRAVNPEAVILTLSAHTGEGLESWLDLLRGGLRSGMLAG